MGQRIFGVVERLCAWLFALTLALSRGEKRGSSGKRVQDKGAGRKGRGTFPSFCRDLCPIPLLCHSRVGGNPVFTKFMPARGVGGFHVHAGMPVFRGTGTLARVWTAWIPVCTGMTIFWREVDGERGRQIVGIRLSGTTDAASEPDFRRVSRWWRWRRRSL